ncbi:LAMI_0A04786g1_1 [Lachancea mirantina]|uniref:LAMI_0A04786g1_1 n=1 Tax=Lachancea mirantina TaxID=1230905 RepID=A0A1G4IPA2_9SACH|nr:LAMI_0A04786g1_1 [Lachancea mirantina]
MANLQEYSGTTMGTSIETRFAPVYYGGYSESRETLIECAPVVRARGAGSQSGSCELEFAGFCNALDDKPEPETLQLETLPKLCTRSICAKTAGRVSKRERLRKWLRSRCARPRGLEIFGEHCCMHEAEIGCDQPRTSPISGDTLRGECAISEPELGVDTRVDTSFDDAAKSVKSRRRDRIAKFCFGQRWPVSRGRAEITLTEKYLGSEENLAMCIDDMESMPFSLEHLELQLAQSDAESFTGVRI